MEFTWLQNWIGSICSILIASIAILLWDRQFENRLKKIVDYTDTKIDDYIFEAFHKPAKFLLFVCGIGGAICFAPVDRPSWMTTFISILAVFGLGWGLFRLSSYSDENTDIGVERRLIHHVFEKREIKHADAISNILSAFFRLAIVLIGIIIILRIVDVDVSAGIASLSIGTALIAFAAKDIFTNFFGSFVILFDEPFKEGDWILADDVEGLVEKITMRSTCIRTIDGELVSIPSSKLSSDKIINKTKSAYRRIDLIYNISPETTTEQVRQLIDKISIALTEIDNIRKTKGEGKEIYTYLDKVTVLSQDIRVICYTDYTQYEQYEDFINLKSEVNLAVMSAIREIGIKMALDDDIKLFKGLMEA